MSRRVESKQIEPDEVLDIRGEVCPFTFIETKLKLEEMNSGEILEVITDHEPAARDVPRSVEQEGHKVLEVRKSGEREWRILLQKNSYELFFLNTAYEASAAIATKSSNPGVGFIPGVSFLSGVVPALARVHLL